MAKYEVDATDPVINSGAAVALPSRELPPELLTGHPLLDTEHQLLIASISGLRDLCSEEADCRHCGDCQPARRRQCESHLVGMLGDLLSFVLEHFRSEEAIMRDSLLLAVDRDLCEAHMEDHAAISGKIQEIVAALDPMNTVNLVRQLESLLTRWVGNHIALHDMLLAHWVLREDSVLREHNLAVP